MITDMDTDNYKTSDASKTAIINNKLLSIKVDISDLEETRLCWFKGKSLYVLLSKSIDEGREHDVGFAVKNTLLQHV